MTEIDADRGLVVAYMRGDLEHLLPEADFWEVYALADGFGLQPPEALAEINGGYDWSHVRDSTPEGWRRMADYLRGRGFNGKTEAKAPPPAA